MRLSTVYTNRNSIKSPTWRHFIGHNHTSQGELNHKIAHMMKDLMDLGDLFFASNSSYRSSRHHIHV